MAPLEDHEEAGKLAIGLDEAGRGPLAGPVVAAGVVLDKIKPIDGLKDSKKLTPKARDELYIQIKKRALFICVKEADVATIDRVNILQATLGAMKEVMSSCLSWRMVDVALIDGNKTVPDWDGIKQIALIRGDQRVQCIMAASIMAKVHRDRLMIRWDRDFPVYGFAKHKGYGTKAHIEAIFRHGPCPLHRMSFAPLKYIGKTMVKTLGKTAEEHAAKYLSKQGFKIIERNVSFSFGELDLVARENNELVFVEVKYRKSPNFALPLEAVNRAKQKKIIYAAKAYLQRHKDPLPACRFDVVSLSGDIKNPDIEHIRDAFWDEGF